MHVCLLISIINIIITDLQLFYHDFFGIHWLREGINEPPCQVLGINLQTRTNKHAQAFICYHLLLYAFNFNFYNLHLEDWRHINNGNLNAFNGFHACGRFNFMPTLLKTSLSSMYLKMVTTPASFSSKSFSLSPLAPFFNSWSQCLTNCDSKWQFVSQRDLHNLGQRIGTYEVRHRRDFYGWLLMRRAVVSRKFVDSVVEALRAERTHRSVDA